MALVSPSAVLGAEYAVLPSGQAFTPTVDGIFIPQSALTAAETTELDPASGNMAEVIRSLMQRSYEYIQGLAAGDRPARWRVTKGNPAVANITGLTGTFLRNDFTSSHDLEVLTSNAAPEA